MKKIQEKIDKICEIFSYPENKDLEEEFIKLFVNSFEGIKCSPYAMDYFNNVNPSDFLLNLKNLYLSAGLEISPDYKEREDHIVTLLEFLWYLIEIETPEKYIKSYVKNYLCWIPEFVKRLKESTKNEYFLNGAYLLEEIYERFR